MLRLQWFSGHVGLFIMTCLSHNNAIMALNSGTNSVNISACSLECENSGVCQYVDGTVEELQYRIQSGLMIMKCVCLENYTGMGCEQVRPICNQETRKCPNNSPCELNSNSIPSQYHCDCSLADQISQISSRFCRNPYTEYCTPEIVNEPLVSFCTNGGKCKADIISAQLAPFNTSVNANYEHAGCICPSEYFGPHCEFMIQQRIASPATIENTNSSTQAPTMDESSYPLETMEPTRDSDVKSIEDLIDEFNNQTTATRNEVTTVTDDRRQILRVVLSSVLVSISIIGLVMVFISYRQRRLTKRPLILIEKLSEETDNSQLIYRSPSITGSGSSSAGSLPSVSSKNSTVKTGTRSKYVDEPLPNSPLRKTSKRKKKKMFNTLNNIPESSDDGDIVTVSNERSFHQRCHPNTPFVVDDDDDELDVDSEIQSTGGLWNDDTNRSGSSSQYQIETIQTSSSVMKKKQQQQQQHQSTDHIQSWIVSLSNRAINFTEIIRQPGYIAPVVLEQVQNTCNDIYLVDDDQDEVDYDNDDDDDNSRFLDKFVDHL